MARRALGPASLAVVQAVAAAADSTGPLLVACSGGADSLALAAGAARVAAASSVSARALVIDHGLQADSAEVARRAVTEASRAGLEAQVVKVAVREAGSGREAAAREARYAALEAAAAADGAVVLLGHTLDDQAETVLLGLARGSGLRSLAGMAPIRGRYRRPLLGLRRAVTEACCAELGLRAWTDPHNSDPAYARVRVRRRVLPVLENELGPGVAEALARTADLARDDAEHLDAVASQALDTKVVLPRGELDCVSVALLGPAVRRRVLRAWLIARGASAPARIHVLAVEALVVDWHGQRGVDVPGLRVVRRGGALVTVAG